MKILKKVKKRRFLKINFSLKKKVLKKKNNSINLWRNSNSKEKIY